LSKEGGCCFLLGVALGCVLCVSILLAPAGREGGGGELEGGLLRTATMGRRPIFPALGNFRGKEGEEREGGREGGKEGGFSRFLLSC